MLYLLTRRSLGLITVASVLLTACTINKLQVLSSHISTSSQWRRHQKDVQKINSYQTCGIFSWISDQQKVYARFKWQQTAPNRYRVLLTNPLGSTEIQFNVLGPFIQLIDNKGKYYISNDAEKLLMQLTGMDIPLTNLRQWILGLPGDAIDFNLDNHYQLRSLRYKRSSQVWHVKIKGYDNKVKPALPIGIELKQDNKCITLRMDSWIVQ